MIWLLVSFWLAGCLSTGFPVARSALKGESLLAVLLPFGLVAGHSMQAVLLVLLWRWLPLGTAIYAAPGLFLFVGAALWYKRARHLKGERLSWGMAPAPTGTVVALALLFAFLGYRIFTVATQVGEVEALFHHSGITAWLERGLFPPTNPLEPDDHLHYRVGIYSLAAGLSGWSGSLPPEGLATTLAMLLPMMVFSLTGASIRVFGRPGPGIAGSVLGLFGGTLFPYYRLYETILLRQGGFNVVDLANGFLWSGNTLDTLHTNPSIAMGFVAFTGALWLWSELLQQRGFGVPLWLVSVFSLAWLGVANEVYFAALLGGIGISAVLTSLSAVKQRKPHWWHHPVTLLTALLAAFGILWACGGILGGVSPVGSQAGSVQLTLNVDHFGFLARAPLDRPVSWVPILTLETFLETDLVILALPVILVALVWRRSASYAVIGMVASAAILLTWSAVYPAYSPPDGFRFGQAGLTTYLSLAPFAIESFLPDLRRRVRPSVLRRLSIAATIILVTPHVALTAGLVVTPQQGFLAPDRPDTMAALYLRQSDATSRVLVPTANPEGGWITLYRDVRFNTMAGSLLALSGDAIPMGEHMGPHDAQRYIPVYREASTTFDPAALAALKIDWVYVAPPYLDIDQLRYLSAAQQRGELKLDRTFGERGTETERLLFRFYPQPAGP